MPPKSDQLAEELRALIASSHVLFRDDLKESDVECALNSLVSLLVVAAPLQEPALVALFAQQLLSVAKSARAAAVASRV